MRKNSKTKWKPFLSRFSKDELKDFKKAANDLRLDLIMKRAISDMADSFRQFSRNGRWGTCCDCPKDTAQRSYPEFCKNAHRYDHFLTVNDLATLWNLRFKKET